MKKLVAILMLFGMLGFTGVNLNRTIKKAHAKNQPTIGIWSDKDDFCPKKGSGCVHLPPVVIK